eukprot:scaffold2471_cov115-Isochrysis_galbana.AAC.3
MPRPAALVPSRQRRTQPWTSAPSGPALKATMRAPRRGSSLPQRDVSAAKTPLGVAAPPFNTSASAVHYQPPRKRNCLSALERSAALCALRDATYDKPYTQLSDDVPYSQRGTQGPLGLSISKGGQG